MKATEYKDAAISFCLAERDKANREQLSAVSVKSGSHLAGKAKAFEAVARYLEALPANPD